MKETRTELEKLQSKRSELIERLSAIEKDFRGGLDADSEERAIQLENAEVLEEIARITKEELILLEKKISMLRS